VEVSLASSGAAPDPAALARLIRGLGYEVGGEGRLAPRLGLGIGLLLALAYLAADRAGLFSLVPAAELGAGYGALAILGLLTSLHCLAMCGGIALGLSVGPGSGSGDESRGGGAARLRPALLYNGGRVLSYTLTGALVGGLGSLIGFSLMAKAALMAAAALAMIAYGLRALGLLRLPSLGIGAGTRLGEAAARASSGRGPFLVGLANGLMPCGPLQTMQLFALGTGSAAAGALSMLAFGLGTAPLMLGLGALAGLVPRRALPVAARAGGILVLAIGLATAGRAAALAGIDLASPLDALVSDAEEDASPDGPPHIVAASLAGWPSGSAASPSPAARLGAISLPAQSSKGSEPIRATIAEGIQTVVTEIGPRSYPPFIVKAGIPLRWIIRARAQDLNGCNNALVVPAYGIEQRLRSGDTVIEFTPTKEGTVPFSCWMGMIRSRFVVEK